MLEATAELPDGYKVEAFIGTVGRVLTCTATEAKALKLSRKVEKGVYYFLAPNDDVPTHQWSDSRPLIEQLFSFESLSGKVHLAWLPGAVHICEEREGVAIRAVLAGILPAPAARTQIAALNSGRLRDLQAVDAGISKEYAAMTLVRVLEEAEDDQLNIDWKAVLTCLQQRLVEKKRIEDWRVVYEQASDPQKKRIPREVVREA